MSGGSEVMAPDRFQPNEEFSELIEFKQRVIDGVRPVLDRRLLRFVDENRPLTRPALVRQGFESAENAILLADRARDLEVLSLEPATRMGCFVRMGGANASQLLEAH